MERPLGSLYVLEEVLGRGATGEVWRGRTHEGQEYAFKVLHDTLARDAETRQRFLREDSILKSIRHPHLVRVHDLVAEGDTLAIVMDLIKGSDLRKPMREHGAMRPGDACSIAAEAASALAAIHEAGVVHRDIKPENVLLDMSSTPPAVRLTDFGIARIAEQTSSKSTMLVGTAPYIAPELADGRSAVPATDLYALGITLYEMCCGVTPFADRSTLVTLQRHGSAAPGRPPEIPDPLWELIEGLLAKDPDDRPAPAARVAILLEALARDLHQLPAAPTLTEPPEAVARVHSVLTDVSMATHPPRPEGTEAVRPAGRRRRGRALAVTAAAVVLVAIVGTAAYAVMRPADDDPRQPAAAPSSLGESAEFAPGRPTAASTSPRPSYGPGKVPDLTGMPEAQARSLLPPTTSLQIVREQAQAGQPDGVVLRQNPPPGSDLPPTLQLTVSSRQATQYLDELTPTSGEDDLTTGTDATDYRLSGRPQLHAVGITGSSCSSGEKGTAEYDLGQNYKQLVGVAGIDDDSPAGKAQATLEFYGDARKLKSVTTTLGKFKELDVDVTGVLRLTLRWTFTGLDGLNCPGATLVIGDGQLVAAAGYVPPSTASPSPSGG
ncbi:protein kinase domain-containing protein [Actinomadura rubrisoli]|uniref:non-specific serine/threonine protein kinase n=1 Tax=Actinomadura rubrisoli TaxID=2530368 RepID=A0A4R5BFN9_9ACTN|nr:protein kinase [Actinomadura rubrisoli]TDD82634.1 PASTA domain-containing protein [Actinomadura rubrisoli]